TPRSGGRDHAARSPASLAKPQRGRARQARRALEGAEPLDDGEIDPDAADPLAAGRVESARIELGAELVEVAKPSSAARHACRERHRLCTDLAHQATSGGPAPAEAHRLLGVRVGETVTVGVAQEDDALGL